MGRAAGGGTGRSWGMGKFMKIAVEPWLPHPIRGAGRTQENQESEYRDADYGDRRVLGSEHFQPRDHSACRPRPRKWAKGYIRIGTLVPCCRSSHSEVGNILEGVVEAVVEIRDAGVYGQIDNFRFAAKLAQHLNLGCAGAGYTARHAGFRPCEDQNPQGESYATGIAKSLNAFSAHVSLHKAKPFQSARCTWGTSDGVSRTTI
jgi:hypothetical protein